MVVHLHHTRGGLAWHGNGGCEGDHQIQQLGAHGTQGGFQLDGQIVAGRIEHLVQGQGVQRLPRLEHLTHAVLHALQVRVGLRIARCQHTHTVNFGLHDLDVQLLATVDFHHLGFGIGHVAFLGSAFIKPAVKCTQLVHRHRTPDAALPITVNGAGQNRTLYLHRHQMRHGRIGLQTQGVHIHHGLGQHAFAQLCAQLLQVFLSRCRVGLRPRKWAAQSPTQHQQRCCAAAPLLCQFFTHGMHSRHSSNSRKSYRAFPSANPQTDLCPKLAKP